MKKWIRLLWNMRRSTWYWLSGVIVGVMAVRSDEPATVGFLGIMATVMIAAAGICREIEDLKHESGKGKNKSCMRYSPSKERLMRSQDECGECGTD